MSQESSKTHELLSAVLDAAGVADGQLADRLTSFQDDFEDIPFSTLNPFLIRSLWLLSEGVPELAVKPPSCCSHIEAPLQACLETKVVNAIFEALALCAKRNGMSRNAFVKSVEGILCPSAKNLDTTLE